MNILVAELEKLIVRIKDELTNEQANQLEEEIGAYVASLLQNDMPALVQFLYKLDVDEHAIVHLFDTDLSASTSQKVSRLIIRRQLEKTRNRKYYSGNDEIENNERW